MKYRFSIAACFILFVLYAALLMFSNALADDAIPFSERSGIKYVVVQINGVSIEFIFDTGANSVVINNDTIQRLGIAEFDNTRKIQSNTAGGLVDGYILTMNSVQAGGTIKYNYDVTYIPSSPANLLGASFFSNFNCYIDEDNGVIRLIPKGSTGLTTPPAATPPASAERQKTGSERIEVEVDGKKYIYGEGWKDEEKAKE